MAYRTVRTRAFDSRWQMAPMPSCTSYVRSEHASYMHLMEQTMTRIVLFSTYREFVCRGLLTALVQTIPNVSVSVLAADGVTDALSFLPTTYGGSKEEVMFTYIISLDRLSTDIIVVRTGTQVRNIQHIRLRTCQQSPISCHPFSILHIV